MAVTVAVNTDKAAYVVGEVITVDVDVQGEFEGSTRTVTVTAQITVDGVAHTGTEDITVNAPPADIDYDSVTAEGLSFVQNGLTPSRWTAVAQ